MQFIKTNLNDATLIQPKIFGDERGFFLESWRQNLFDEHLNQGQPLQFVQDNHSSSIQGVLRGLHYQLRYPQGKLVRVLQGEVYDVLLDLRPSSSTFGQWQGFYLSADNKSMLWSPPGFAHGFYVLSDSAEFAYKCTEYYHPEDENSIVWNDPDLKIDWPLVANQLPSISDKDRNGKLFTQLNFTS